MIKFEWAVATFVTLVCVIMTAFFLSELGRAPSPYMDDWVIRKFVPMVVLVFGWGIAGVMWFSIATGRDLFK